MNWKLVWDNQLFIKSPVKYDYKNLYGNFERNI